VIIVELFKSTIAKEQSTGMYVETYKDPISRLARKLRENGFNEQEPVRVMRDDIQVFKKDHTLKYWADHDWVENNNNQVQRRKYTPFKAWGTE
jgi:hypothetical protein